MSVERLELPLNEHSDEEDFYLQEVARFFLALRGTGLFLSPIDAALIEKWQESGVALTTVLRGMHRGAEKLLAKKQPLRSLKRLKRYVDREAKHDTASEEAGLEADRQPMDPAPVPGYDKVKALIEGHVAELEALEREAAESGVAALAGLCARVRVELRELEAPARWGAAGPVPALMGLGRRFYEGLETALPEADREVLQSEAEAALRGMAESMSAEARAESQRELRVSILRERFRLFEPRQLFSLWDDA